MINWSEYPHFLKEEFDCKHCGANDMKPQFVQILEDLRTDFGKPIAISSGYRCAYHNKAVSGSGENGPHTTGRAADILINGSNALTMLSLALDAGVRRVGVSQKGLMRDRFIHIDTSLTHPSPAIWSY
tara:strand:+ start:57 stop:440 length:384 start_codon:yes stop_codon:yes gene_type:complete